MPRDVICRIDGTLISAGGSKTDRLCARCYQRKRRGAPLIAEHGKLPPGEGVQRTFRLSLVALTEVEQRAKEEGIGVAEWIRRAVDERLKRQPRRLKARKQS